jgi:hypothetical protein
MFPRMHIQHPPSPPLSQWDVGNNGFRKNEENESETPNHQFAIIPNSNKERAFLLD